LFCRLLFFLLATQPLPAQSSSSGSIDRFQFDAQKIETGLVYHYEKSNIDGTHASNVSLFVADTGHVESFKWSPWSRSGTLVTAELDWETFSVRRFESWRLGSAGERSAVAKLRYLDSLQSVEVWFGPTDTVRIEYLPWHSYDFDFASLNMSLRHLVDPHAPFNIGIADVVRSPGGFRFAFKGLVEMRYVGEEVRYEVPCRKYEVNGPGLEDRGGAIWVSRADGHIVDYEIDLPDEPGYRSGKLRLRFIEQMTNEGWGQFIRSSLGESPGP
jgi:hypothetical protein